MIYFMSLHKKENKILVPSRLLYHIHLRNLFLFSETHTTMTTTENKFG